MSSNGDVVWALHAFEAENPDEISFAAGESIVVVEKDDMFGDGWWQGRNQAGQVGLFPESYTSKTKVVKGLNQLNGKQSTVSTISESTEPGGTMMQSTLTEVEQAIQSQQVPPSAPESPVDDKTDTRSIRSVRSTRSNRSKRSKRAIPDDAASIVSMDPSEAGDVPQNYPNARSALAARAKMQLEEAAQAAQDREAEKRKEEDRYRQLHNDDYGDSPPIQGLELSDESDLDEDYARPTHFERLYGSQAPQAPPRVTSLPEDADPFARDAPRFPLPISPAPDNTSFSAQQIAVPVDAQPARGHSPSGSISSRRSRKSFDASALPPVPPVPAVIEEPAQSPSRPQSFTDGIRRSLSLSRKSSRTSLKGRRSSVSSQKRPSSTVIADPNPQIEAQPTEQQQATHVAPLMRSNSIPRTKSGTFSQPPISPQPDASVPSTAVVREPFVEQDSQREILASQDNPLPVDTNRSPLSSPTDRFVAQERSPALIQTQSPAAAQQPLAHPYLHRDEPIPVSPATVNSFTRPDSQTGYTHTGYGNSIRTHDNSPRSSIGSKLPSDPRNWSVENVIDWGRSKGFDATTLSKFQEHEISGDVLLEMDINTLKEIDLPAFGRRVHINNGIKELKRIINPDLTASTTTMSQSQASFMRYPGESLSPSMSGYEPDTPGTRSAFSPSDSFSPNQAPLQTFPPSLTAMMAPSPTESQMGQRRQFEAETASRPSTDSSRLRGLGLDSTQGSNVQRAANDQPPRASASVASLHDERGHKRSQTEGTMDTFHSASGDTGLINVDETAEYNGRGGALTDTELVRTDSGRRFLSRNKNKSTTSVGSRQRTSTEPETRQSVSVPTSPMTGRAPFTKKSSSFMPQALRARKPPPSSPTHSRQASETDKSKSRRSFFGFNSSPAPNSPVLGSPTQNRPRISAPVGSERSPAQDSKPVNGITNIMPDQSVYEEPTSINPATINTSPQAINTSSSPLEKIGKPDLDGWLKKKSDRYGTWKSRYILLKGLHLYFMKSPQEKKIKGWIPLNGYKVLPDSDSSRGNYGFKLTHPTLPSHYFASEDPLIVRKFMKALMKSSIVRDFQAPVVASSNIPTMSLEEAQAMFPPPRPPSPTSRDRLQKARLGGVNPNQLTPRDAEILVSLQKTAPPPKSTKRESRRESKFSSLSAFGGRGDRRSIISVSDQASVADQSSPDTGTFSPQQAPIAQAPPSTQFTSQSPGNDIKQTNVDDDLLDWVNSHLPHKTPRATNFTTSFQSGEILTRLTEDLSSVYKPDLQGENRFKLPAGSHDSFGHVDALLDYFDYLVELKVDTQDVAVAEVLRGDAPQIIKLLKALKSHFGQGSEVLL